MTPAAQWGELAKRIEAATGASWEIDAAICITADWSGPIRRYHTFQGPHVNLRISEDSDPEAPSLDWEDTEGLAWTGDLPELTASLDAIVSLIERELPGVRWKAGKSEGWESEKADESYAACGSSKIIIGATPALALCQAFCEAMAAVSARAMADKDGE